VQQTVGGPQGNALNEEPKIASTGSSAIIACIDSENNVDCWRQVSGPPYFQQERVATASGSDNYGFPAIALAGGYVLISSVDASGAVYFWGQPPGSANWYRETVANL